MSKRSALVLAWLAIVPLGCTSTEVGRKTMQPGVEAADLKTKQDLLANLGGPSNVMSRGDLQLWIYIHTLGKGGGFGVGNYALFLLFGNEHRYTDSALFVVGSDGRVLKSRLLRGSDKIDGSIWPF